LKTDRGSFDDVAMCHLDALFRAATAMCGDRSQAEDLVQETFLKAFERFESFRQGTNCKAWLLRIMRNTWIDRLRHIKVVGRTYSLDEDLVAEESGGGRTVWSDAEDMLENFSDEQVIRALGKLPADQRLALFLTDVEQLSQKEVAEVTGVAVGTVKSRVSRARAALKKVLGLYAEEMGLTGGAE